MSSQLKTSFGIPYNPDTVFCLDSKKSIRDVLSKTNPSKKIIVLGSATNTIISDELTNFDVLLIQNKEVEVFESTDSVLIKTGAGITFDELVEFTVSHNWSGLEALSAIPGTVGASPIQNIGAYGAEVSDVIESVDVFDREEKALKTFLNAECDFGYRKSRFNTYDKNRFIVVSVSFLLAKNSPITIPNYPGVSEYLLERTIKHPTLANIRKCITSIRWSKLPNPVEVGNTGSFFKNALVNETTFKKLISLFPHMPHFSTDTNAYKIPTGWLLDQAGLKGTSVGPITFYKNHALVLTNQGNATFQDLHHAINQTKMIILEKFGIRIEVEPELIY